MARKSLLRLLTFKMYAVNEVASTRAVLKLPVRLAMNASKSISLFRLKRSASTDI